ncbi:MAG: rhomboid family intramembrane serine protease [Myxococcota bacterium]
MDLEREEGAAGRPWATWALLGLSLAAAVAWMGVPDAGWRWGIVPAAPRLVALVAHPFVHAGWLHVLGTVVFLALAGPWLEAQLGRALFVAGFFAAALVGATAFVATHPGAEIAWIGGSAAVAGLLGATLVGVGRGRIDVAAVAGGALPALRAPGFALAALFLGRELAGFASGDTAGLVAHAASFGFGAVLALALRRSGVIEPPFRAVETSETSVATSLRTQLASVPEVPLPEDPAQQEALLGESTEPALARMYLRDAATGGRLREARAVVEARLWEALEWRRREPAVALWCALVETGPAPRGALEPLLQLASWLRGAGLRTESGLALHAALASDEPEAASKVARAARRFDPVVCYRAAERALADTGLGPSDRKMLEGLRLEAERDVVARGVILIPHEHVSAESRARRVLAAGAGVGRRLPEAPAEETPRKLEHGEAIELEPEPQPVPVSLPDPAEAGDANFLDAFHQALSEPEDDEIEKEEELPLRTLRVREALPRSLESDALVLDVPGRKPVRLSLTRLHAVALAGVRGVSEREGNKPVLIVDLLLSPEADTELQVLRLRSDRFDPRRLSVVPESSPLKALRAFVSSLATAAHAPLLPQAEIAGDAPLRVYRDLPTYHREVLRAV